jgi:hypothetical protein
LTIWRTSGFLKALSVSNLSSLLPRADRLHSDSVHEQDERTQNVGSRRHSLHAQRRVRAKGRTDLAAGETYPLLSGQVQARRMDVAKSTMSRQMPEFKLEAVGKTASGRQFRADR